MWFRYTSGFVTIQVDELLCGSGPAVPYRSGWISANELTASGRAAAELLRRVGHGDIAEMGALLAQAVPPVTPAVMLAAGPELTGRVVTYRWPAGGPPGELLGLSGQRVEHGAETVRPSACQRCGNPLHADGSRSGRPARYCSGACRTAAHRARHRTVPDIPTIPTGQLA